jgi:hypothetical protein
VTVTGINIAAARRRGGIERAICQDYRLLIARSIPATSDPGVVCSSQQRSAGQFHVDMLYGVLDPKSAMAALDAQHHDHPRHTQQSRPNP